MTVRGKSTHFSCKLPNNGANEVSMPQNSFSTYSMFALHGDLVIAKGLYRPIMFDTEARREVEAVVVTAISLIPAGKMLLTSPIRRSISWNVSPL